MTQFFLAHVNIHCAENNISSANFGVILDDSNDLSNEVAGIIVTALGADAEVEESLCSFFNEHTTEFGLTRPLAKADIDAIKQRFTTNYATVKDSEHMDDFMILNTATDTGKFVTHQGSICTDFSELVVNNTQLDNAFFQAMRADFEAPQSRIIPHQNRRIQASIELDIEDILSRVTDHEQLKLLDEVTLNQIKMSPAFQSRLFLLNVAHGKQNEARQQVEENPALLLATGRFTDYSGRTFNCTAYEYAYWAKDKHMCRMLEAHMDEQTKAVMLERIDAIEQNGLTYEQNGEIKNSKHFDLGPLIQALQDYVDGFGANSAGINSYAEAHALKASWGMVGLAQRDLPVHVVNEYCRSDQSFKGSSTFNEDNLQRTLEYSNVTTEGYRHEATWFPLVTSGSFVLGVEFAITSASDSYKFNGIGTTGFCIASNEDAINDLEAVRRLEEVRTADLSNSRANLLPVEPEHQGRNLP